MRTLDSKSVLQAKSPDFSKAQPVSPSPSSLRETTCPFWVAQEIISRSRPLRE
jgi:hypothetical protein